VTIKSGYPISLNISDKLCTVIGGGKVAQRKIKGLLAAGTKIKLISPQVTKTIAALASKGHIELISKTFEKSDLEGATLVFAATDNKDVNINVAEEAHNQGLFVNVADNPNLSDFFVPSVIRKPPILITLSTSGQSPGLSKKLRKELLKKVSSDYQAYARHLGIFRQYVVDNADDKGTRKKVLDALYKADPTEITKMSLFKFKKHFLNK
jgi:precorrin-2 dehydrogenase / sirohydrochlorin ferrochelatase